MNCLQATISLAARIANYFLVILLISFAMPAHAQNAQVLESLPGALSGSLMNSSTQPFDPLLNNKQNTQPVNGIKGDEARPSLAKGKTSLQKRVNQNGSATTTLNIRIKHIQVEGVTQLTTDEVASVTTPFQNTEMSLTELEQKVVQPLNRLYQEKGLVTTNVYIPPQKLSGGILIIRSDEGTVGEIVFEEGRHFKEKAVLPKVNLEIGKPFNLCRLENSLYRINENPDLHLAATLQAGKNPNETRVILRTVQEGSPIHLSPFMDNLGRNIIGNNRFGATLTHNNLLGYGDVLNSSFSFTRHSWGNASSYEVPVGKHGTKLGFNYALNDFGFAPSGFNFQGRSTYSTPYITQELYRSEKSILTAELGLGIKNSSLNLEGYTLHEDRIRTLTPAINWSHYDSTGRTLVRAEMGIGLNLFNATLKDSPSTSRPGAGSQFLRYTGYAVRVQKLPKNTYGVFKAMGQFTPSKLVSLEQFQIGGVSTVRGYTQGRLIGDSGFVLSAEWHAPLGFLPEYLKFASWRVPLKNQLELVGFTDFGGVFDNSPFSGVNIQSNRVVSSALIGGAGVGLRVNLTKKLAARLDLGFPVVKLAGNTTRRPRLHFGLESRLF